MKKSGGSFPKTHPPKNVDSQTSSFPLQFFNPQNPFLRRLVVIGLLGIGFYLIETPTSVGRCVLGIMLWALAVSRFPLWFPAVPGIPVFSGSVLQNPFRSGTWDATSLFLAGLVTLGLIGASLHFVQSGNWLLVIFSLLLLGGMLILVERNSPTFEADPPPSTPLPWEKKFPWPALAILLVGSFFLFFGWDLYPIGRDNNTLYNLAICDSYLFPNGRTSPYVDGWTWGNPSLPYFFIGVLFKVVGSSPAWGTLLIALFTLVGYFFFYGFLRFYLPRIPALVATLLFSSSHWTIYFGREISAGAQLIPFECATFFYFAKSLEGGKSKDFVLFGTMLSCLWMTAIHTRALLVALVLTFAVLAVRYGSQLRSQTKPWFLACGVGFLWYLPMLIYYQQHHNFLGLGSETIGRESSWGGGHFFIPWGHIQQGLQMFTYRSLDSMTANLPRLSPWEGLLLITGFAWCLWRFFKPAFFFVITGFFFALTPAVFSNNPTLPPRALAVAPFAYILVGIGLDRLGKTIASPLGRHGKTIQFVFMALILAFSLQWQYDVFFNQMSRDKYTYSIDGSDQDGQRFIISRLLDKYEGWESYEDSRWFQITSSEGGFTRTSTTVDPYVSFRHTLWPAWSGLPLKSILPKAKGIVLMLGDNTGKAYQDWVEYYYPGARFSTAANNFQDIQVRIWEISPTQVQEALQLHPGPPPTGLTLTWYDSKNHRLGQWQIPTLSTGYLMEDYFRDNPAEKSFPWDKVAYFKVSGKLNREGMPWVLQTKGQVDTDFGGRRFHWVGGIDGSQFDIPVAPQGWVPFEIRYTPPQQAVFELGFSQRSPTGWDLVPASQLKP